ncbi:MAG: SDR family oxidoreductase [Anaerolineales bacterium]|nr:MAG: SDR family oxidoreductase [Anaerolineales bacterium]
MKIIVITGSTRGIGYGLADSFLALGCAVTISGRTLPSVEKAVAELAAQHEPNRVLGQPCDVTDLEQVQALWDAAKAHFGKIDIWINNAGIGHPQMDSWELSPEQIKAVVDTNLVGAMYGAKVALRGMLDQGFGSFYNMEGLGSDDRMVRGLALYGCTKAGLRYLTQSWVQETQETPVLVGALRPGMIMTDLVTKQYEERPEDWERDKRMINILADRVETVTPWLAQKVLANDKTGVRFTWLTRRKVIARFLAAPFRKRNLCE